MQGTTLKKLPRVLTAAAFVIAFFVGAATTFFFVHLVGTVVGVSDFPLHYRLLSGGLLLIGLAFTDRYAISRGTYCPITWRRQTPRALLRRFPVPVAVAIWGFDTGLVVTTFRVAAATWASLILTLLGIAPPWIGLAYAIGFTLPFLILALRPELGRASREDTSIDPGLEALLRRRSQAQWGSLGLLILTGCGLLISLSDW